MFYNNIIFLLLIPSVLCQGNFLSTIFNNNGEFSYNLTLPVFLQKVLLYPRDNYLYFTEKVKERGYIAADYTVQTEDGYLLQLFEVRSPQCQSYRDLPILMIHGVFFNADIFLVADRDAALAYLLAQDCHRVFVGNVRGTDHGRNHINLDPDTQAEFWDFSLTELGKFDVTGMIDFVLERTGSRKLNYIGYSQGASVFLIALSTRPEYNKKVEQSILLSPALNLHYTKSLGFKIVFNTVSFLKCLLRFLGINELLFKGSVIQVFLQFLCHNTMFTMPLCTGILSIFDAYYPGSILPRTLENLVAIFPVGVSMKQILHYQQLRPDNTFQDYDYGAEENYERYGTQFPPNFDTYKITIPTHLITGRGDRITTVEEVKHIQDLVINSTLEFVSDKRWNHVDEVLNPRIRFLSYPLVKKYLDDTPLLL